MHPKTIALSALAAILTAATGALPGATARQATSARMSLGPAALRFGRSLGSPTEGRLVGGTHLDETVYIRVMPADAAGDVRWGLEPLVEMIDRAARTVRRQFPGLVTSVGHLSREGGGDVERHRSHESGRDADIGFFVRSAEGRQLFSTHFVPFRSDGTATGWPGAYFDDGPNWAFVAALVTDPEAHVTHVFVASPLRARLLAYAERTGVAAAVRVRAAEVMQQPRGALPHDDHFHVRIACPARMSGCVENPLKRNVASTRKSKATRRPGATPPAPASGSTPPSSPVDPRRDESGVLPASMPAAVDDVDG
jgi:penicillin-insensitive murein DD-endopeptidase